MKFASSISLALLTLAVGTVVASPRSPAASTNDRCGKAFANAVCSTGECCSLYGWCGATSDYCGTGCQSQFGSCTQSNPASASSASASGKGASPDGSCGGSKGYTCLNSGDGNCCSKWGWCGSSSDYCGTGCKTTFGTCGAASSSRSTSSTRSSSQSSLRRSSSTSTRSSSVTSQSSRRSSSTRTASPTSSRPSSSTRTSSSISNHGSSSSSRSSVSSSTLSLSASFIASSSTPSLLSSSSLTWSSSASSGPASSSSALSSSASSSFSASSSTSSAASSSSIQLSSSSSAPSSSSSSATSSSSSSSSAPSSSSSSTISLSVSSIWTSSSVSPSSSSVLPSSSSSSASSSSSSSSSSFWSTSSSSSSFSVSTLSSSSLTSSSSAMPSSSSSPANSGALFSSDPLQNPAAFTLSKTSDFIDGSFVNASDAHSGGGYLRISSTDPNGASLRAATAITVQSGTTYQVTLWVRSTGAGTCTASVSIDGVVATSGDSVSNSWTAIQGYYTTNPTDLTPTVTLIVSCPQVAQSSPNRKRLDSSAGMDVDDLSMNVSNASPSDSAISISPSSSLTTTSSDSSSSIATTASDSSSALSSSVLSSGSYSFSSTSLSMSSTSSMTSTGDSSSTPSGVSSTALATITASSGSSSSITSTASLSQSSSSSVSALTCQPTIIDPSFELVGATGLSSDWSIGNVDSSGAGTQFFSSNPTGTYHEDGSYSYFVWTNATASANYSFQYLHPIQLCKDVVYQIGYWTRGYKYRSAQTNGCHVDVILNNQAVFWDRIGRADSNNFRYVGGQISFPQDVPAAQLVLNFICPVTTIASNNRGVIFDKIDFLPASQFTPPPTPTTPPPMIATSTDSIFPWSTSCVPTETARPPASCVLYGEQIGNPSFESCAQDQFFDFTDNGNDTEYNLVTTQNGFSTEKAHTGVQSFKVVINNPGYFFGIQFFGFTACPERNFMFSFYSMQLTAGACVVNQLWGGKLFNTYVPQADGGWTFSQDTLINPKTDDVNEQYFELQVVCDQIVGLDAAVYIDDVSVVQVQ